MLANGLQVDDWPAHPNNCAVDRRVSVAPRFGTWLKLLRGFAGLDQEPLAERAKIPVGQVRALEQGENVGLVYLQAVISALSVVAAEHEDFVKLRRALDHEAFRHMTADSKDQAALKRRASTEEPPGEVRAPMRLRRLARGKKKLA